MPTRFVALLAVKYRPKHIAEYVGLRGVAWMLQCLPQGAALQLGQFLASAAFFGFRFRRDTASARIRTVFGDRFDEREVRRIAWLSFRNLILNAVEMIRMGGMTREAIRDYFPTRSVTDAMLPEIEKGTGVIGAVAHTGNWELAAVSSFHGGLPVFSFAANQKNPLVDAYLNRVRASSGIPTVLRDSGSLRQIIRRLNERQVLAILPDVRMRTPGLPIPFLGGTANVGPGMASFSRQTGSPIILCLTRRHGLERHSVETQPPIYPDHTLSKKADVERMTRLVMGRIEAFIRSEPEQWFWFNKRWILDPL